MNDNEKLNSALEQGETIKWSGVPQAYSLFDESRKKSTIFTVCCAAAWAVLSIGGYYAAVASSNADIKTGVIVFLLATACLIVWMPISDKGKVKKLTYAVTDKRVLIVSKEDRNPIAMPFSDIDAIRVDKADNGSCNVRVGSSTFKTSLRKLPSLAYLGRFTLENDNKSYTGLALFNVKDEDGKKISNLLEPAIASAKA